MARALAGNPTILLADEPITALDAENGRAMMHTPTNLALDRGVSVIIVTHADRILHLHDGKLTDEGDAVATAQRPADLAGSDRRSERSLVR
jgi:ABC-type lipoprotein export system ATPase subunit